MNEDNKIKLEAIKAGIFSDSREAIKTMATIMLEEFGNFQIPTNKKGSKTK